MDVILSINDLVWRWWYYLYINKSVWV